MKKILNWQVFTGIILILLAVIFYITHYLIFRDMDHIIRYLVGDIAFLFLQIFVATIVIDRLLKYREKMVMMRKLNMIIGAFFIEAGTQILKTVSSFDPKGIEIANSLTVKSDWTGKEFAQISRKLKKEERTIDLSLGNLEEMRDFLKQKRKFLVNLIQNPNLMEHETFTDLLWSIFHLTDELGHRDTMDKLIESDAAHLAGDIKRAYGYLIIEWLDYMRHLKKNYPYLFSIAIRTNPFDPNASIVVK